MTNKQQTIERMAESICQSMYCQPLSACNESGNLARAVAKDVFSMSGAEHLPALVEALERLSALRPGNRQDSGMCEYVVAFSKGTLAALPPELRGEHE